jgi:hypothetical protein
MPHVTPLHADDPRRVGRYRLTGRVEGMPVPGPVYVARTVDGSEVTITLLAGDWTRDAADRDRFTAEANAACRVAPFGAARILGSGFDGKDAFLVREYVAGPSLRELVDSEGPWEGDDLEALAVGTATGLVHGEFGPEHVVLGVDGPRVIEFGITPPYGAATPAADLRAWAFTMLYAAAGGPATPADLEVLSEPLRTLATECMSPGPGERPTARSIVIELLGDADPPAGVLGEGSRRAARVAVRPAPASDPQPRAAPRRAVTMRSRPATIWWAVGILGCILAIGVAIWAAQNQSAPQAGATRPAPTGQPAAKATHADRPRGSPTPPPTVPASLAGTWAGQVMYTSLAGTFPVNVQVSLVSGPGGGTVRYSGPFSCLDSLSLVSDLARTLTLNQGRVQGPCQRGVVTLVPGPGNTLQFSFNGKGAPPAKGTLNRL